MSETIGYMLAQAYEITAQSPTTTDDRGGPTARVLAAGWYRTFLAATSGSAGTEASPHEILTALTTALDALVWTVSIAADGRVRFTYLGSGTGSVDLSVAPTLRALLGWSGNVGPLASGATSTGTYQATHAVFSISCDPDTGWVDAPQRFAGATLPTGAVYGWHDGRATYRRTCTLAWLPRDYATRTSHGATGTPAFSDASRLLSPSTSEPAQSPPWAASDTLVTAAGRACAICWGTFQELYAGSATAFDIVYLSPEMAATGQRFTLSVPSYDARRHVSMELVFAGAGARS